MKKIFALVLVFLASSLLLVTYLPISTAQNQDFKVLNYSWYTSPTTGYFVVVGELQNIGSKVYGNAIIRGLVYTVDGVEQATETYSLVCASILEPNDTAPFYMEYTGVTSVMGNLSWVGEIIVPIRMALVYQHRLPLIKIMVFGLLMLLITYCCILY